MPKCWNSAIATPLKRSYSRWLTLNPISASPPATTRATQLTAPGIDQSAMVMLHSSNSPPNGATTAKIRPEKKKTAFRPWRDQLNRRRTLVGPATNSSCFVAITYANDSPNRTAVQDVLSYRATTSPSSWVTAYRMMSPILMLMLFSFSLQGACRNGLVGVRRFRLLSRRNS